MQLPSDRELSESLLKGNCSSHSSGPFLPLSFTFSYYHLGDSLGAILSWLLSIYSQGHVDTSPLVSPRRDLSSHSHNKDALQALSSDIFTPAGTFPGQTQSWLMAAHPTCCYTHWFPTTTDPVHHPSLPLVSLIQHPPLASCQALSEELQGKDLLSTTFLQHLVHEPCLQVQE